MHICYAVDNNFLVQTMVSMSSIAVFANKKDIWFHVLDAGLTDLDVSLLRSHAERLGAELRLYDMRLYMNRVRATGQASWGDFPTYATWARMFLPEILPDDVDRVLYLDGDVIANGDYTVLFQKDMRGCVAAAVEDCVKASYKEGLGLPPSARYVNAGVLLFDLNQWKRQYDPAWLGKYLTKGIYYPMADQDVVNLMFQGKIVYLPLKYNYTSWFRALSLQDLKVLMGDENLCRHTVKELAECKKDAILIHYNRCSLLIRPWYKGTTDPASKYWRKYYNGCLIPKQPFEKEPLGMGRGELRDRRLYQIFGAKGFIYAHWLDWHLRKAVKWIFAKLDA